MSIPTKVQFSLQTITRTAKKLNIIHHHDVQARQSLADRLNISKTKCQREALNLTKPTIYNMILNIKTRRGAVTCKT